MMLEINNFFFLGGLTKNSRKSIYILFLYTKSNIILQNGLVLQFESPQLFTAQNIIQKLASMNICINFRKCHLYKKEKEKKNHS